MTTPEVLQFVKAQPFRPFRIHMASGRSFDVRHPEMVRVGLDTIILFSLVNGSTEVYDGWESVSLTLIESISHIDASVGQEGN